MLRSAFVIAIIIFGIRQSMRGPFYALLFYLWIAYFRPEQWLWYDFFSQLQLSFIVGLMVLGGTILSGRQLRFSGGPTLMFLFLAQALASSVASDTSGYAFLFWRDFAKSTLISFLIITLVDSEAKLRQTLIVIGLSLGLEAAKQGWVQLILNPGGQNINEHPVLGDNNGVAVGMLMLVALLIAVGRTSVQPSHKMFARFLAVGVLYRAIVTYSRGGFLACAGFGAHYLVRSRRKFMALVAIVTVALLILPVLPDAFWDRMNSIPRGSDDIAQSDYSTRSRLHFWRVALVMANENPLLGVGYNSFNPNYDRYDFMNGVFGRGRSVHSSWLAVLAELGYPGLILFLMIVGKAWFACRRAQRLAKMHPELKDLAAYGGGIESALVTFGVGGTFVIFQYSEMLWHTLALALVVDRLVAERAAQLTAKTPEPRASRAIVPPRVGVAAAVSATGRA